MSQDDSPLPWLSRACGRQIHAASDVIDLLDVEADMTLAEDFPPSARQDVLSMLGVYLRGSGRIALHHELVSWMTALPDLAAMLEDDCLNDTAYRARLFYLALTGSRLLPLTPRRLIVRDMDCSELQLADSGECSSPFSTRMEEESGQTRIRRVIWCFTPAAAKHASRGDTFLD